MLRIKVLVLIFLAFPNYTLANDSKPKAPDLIECLKVIEPLESRYRGWMQQSCVGTAGDICVGDLSGYCLSELSSSMRTFYSQLFPKLPASIEPDTFGKRSYEKALRKIASSFHDVSKCTELKGRELQICEYLELAGATVELIYRARQAEVSLP